MLALAALACGCVRAHARHDPTQEPRDAATRGDADAQFEMGVRLVDDVSARPDYGEAAAWFRRAAEHGHAGAQAALGNMYAAGEGVPRSAAEAATWLDRAARSASPERDAYALWRDYVVSGHR